VDTIIWLRPHLAQALLHEAESAQPNEACGLLLGIGHEVRQVVPIRNAASTPQTAYRLDEQAFVKAMYQGEANGLTLLGFYHSHPKSEPIPSQTDIAQCFYPDAVQLIIGLKPKPSMLAWRIYNGQVDAVELHLSEQAPPPQRQTPKKTQDFTIVIGAIIACVIMIALSLALLPPAPPIPGQ
jgi:desampylase